MQTLKLILKSYLLPITIGVIVAAWFTSFNVVYLAYAKESIQRPFVASQSRLDAAKLRVCQNRQNAIKDIMSHIIQRAEKQLDVFSVIADRVEAFYVTRGKTLSNYNDLVADINAKKAIAQADLNDMQAARTQFNCDNPRAIVEAFKVSLKQEISALKAYRTAIKNLIVSVKSVQGQNSSTDSQSRNGATQ